MSRKRIDRLVAILLLLGLLACGDGAPWRETRPRRSDDGGPLEAVVESLSQQVTSLTAQVTSLTAQVAELKAKAANDELAIAFHARSNDHTINVLPGGPIVLSRVVTAVGTGYDAQTGYFEAPVSGTYLFIATATVQAPGVAWINIMVDSSVEGQLVSNSAGSELDQGSVSVPVHVRKGQRVHLINASGDAQRTLRGEIYTSFTGVLVQAD